MPTGYTAKIVDGQSFPDYVKTCLRAMGVCVSMRDLPMDTPIPEFLVYAANTSFIP